MKKLKINKKIRRKNMININQFSQDIYWLQQIKKFKINIKLKNKTAKCVLLKIIKLNKIQLKIIKDLNLL